VDGGLLCALVVVGIVVVLLLAGDLLSLGARADRRRAQERAEALLRDTLLPDELDQLDQRGYLEVVSRAYPGRSYRIRPGKVPAVMALDHDAPVAYLCLQPIERLPGRESVLVHKLMLEADEDEYWRRANVFRGLSIAIMR
jgi:hypothetical protein